jgi:Flp pilus assembly protein TadG
MAAMNMSRRRATDESGAELIEFALVLPLLLIILLGIIEFGFLFQRYEVVTNAAREGARMAVLPGHLGYTNADIQARVNQYLTASGLPGTATVPAPTTSVVPVGGGRCVTVRTVTVSYPHQYMFLGGFVAAFTGTTNLTAVSSMRRELTAGTC